MYNLKPGLIKIFCVQKFKCRRIDFFTLKTNYDAVFDFSSSEF
jgi:hypothetical protein